MKKISSLIITIIVSFTLSYSACPTCEINKLDRQVEKLLDGAARHMINFILTQSETEYYDAMKITYEANQLNNQIIIRFEKITGIARRVECSILQDREEEFYFYNDESLKYRIMNEGSQERKIKVRYRGQVYMLSKESKKIFDRFNIYLPRN